MPLPASQPGQRPQVFVSYSYDGQEHETWVLAFCHQLRAAGIDAYCDQTEVSLGEDITLFMDRAAHADRWLCICTPGYVRKVNQGVGGAGYERMSIAAELMTRIDTNRFIPVVRVLESGMRFQEGVPALLRTRVGLDLRDGPSFDGNLQRLIHDLRNGGRNPAAVMNRSTTPMPVPPTAPSRSPSVPSGASQATSSAEGVFQLCETLTSVDRVARGPGLMRGYQRCAITKLREIASQRDILGVRTDDDIEDILKVAVESASPWLAGLLVDGMPGQAALAAPTEIITEMLDPPSWDHRAGRVHAGLPRAMVYFAHVWLGASRIKVGKLQAAVDFAAAPIADPHLDSHRVRMALDVEFMGALRLYRSDGVRSTFQILMDGFRTWPWLSCLFDDERDYRVHCTAYYLALHLNEFAAAVFDCETQVSDPQRIHGAQWQYQVPPIFMRDDDGLVDDAFRKMNRTAGAIEWIWSRNNVSALQLRGYFPGWKRGISQWLVNRQMAPWASIPYVRMIGAQVEE